MVGLVSLQKELDSEAGDLQGRTTLLLAQIVSNMIPK